MAKKRAYLLQGLVFLLVGGILLFARDDRRVVEAILTLMLVFAVSAWGFVLALRERARERVTPRRPSSRRYRAVAAASDSLPGED
ncbi:hypothetical protein ACIQTT_11835 [Microbacterium sp. NPDC090225]|uniref:hypothetical protein n=1 Tax=Microbacterium sp. NPDC090225 TaxID=3364207 RepID=UPI003806EDC6